MVHDPGPRLRVSNSSEQSDLEARHQRWDRERCEGAAITPAGRAGAYQATLGLLSGSWACEGKGAGSCVQGERAGTAAFFLPRYTGLTTRQRQENRPSMRGAVKKGLAAGRRCSFPTLLLTSWVWRLVLSRLAVALPVFLKCGRWGLDK